MRGAPFAPSMAAALAAGSSVSVVAEVKRRSPSGGATSLEIDPSFLAGAYQRGGATAISVLTEPDHFGGSPEDLVAARSVVGLPVLRKDFVVDVLQLLEARAIGASAVLLIARALPDHELTALATFARDVGLEILVEVRTERELEVALGLAAPMIGVNSRDLESLRIDEITVPALLPRIPRSVVAIAESGIRDVVGVERAAAAGADAVLVGAALSGSPDPERAVRALLGVARRGRAA